MLENLLNHAKRERIIALDLLRGFFLFVIIVDHLHRFPNGFDFITGRGELWVSAAEGFVVISGILIGYIYGPRMKKDAKITIKRLLKRALTIYVCVVGLSFFFMAYAFMVAAIPNDSLEFYMKYHTNIPQLLFDSFTLQYIYGWSEFLSHYVVYLFIAPFVLYALIKNKGIFVIIASVLIWMLAFSPFEMKSRYDFTMSWQILFIGGIIFGYYLPQISTWIHRRFSKKSRTGIKRGFTIASLAIFAISLYLTWGNQLLGTAVPSLQNFTNTIQNWWNPFFSQSGLALLVDKTSLGPLRILFGIIVFWWLFIFFSDYGKRLPESILTFFRVLGEKSLFVYGLQAVVVFFVGLYVSHPTSFKEIPVLNTGITLLVLVIIYQVTKNTEHFRAATRRFITKITS